jgi:hypothetical protein
VFYRVYRGVAWQRVDQIRYSIFEMKSTQFCLALIFCRDTGLWWID